MKRVAVNVMRNIESAMRPVMVQLLVISGKAMRPVRAQALTRDY